MHWQWKLTIRKNIFHDVSQSCWGLSTVHKLVTGHDSEIMAMGKEPENNKKICGLLTCLHLLNIVCVRRCMFGCMFRHLVLVALALTITTQSSSWWMLMAWHLFDARASAANTMIQGSQCLSGLPQGNDDDSNGADSRFATSQWEMALLCNDFSHWLGKWRHLYLAGHKPRISPEQWASYFSSILSSVDQHSCQHWWP